MVLLIDLVLDFGLRPAGSFADRSWFDEDEDGFFWVERPPTSVPGELRLRGLIFIGMWTFEGRQEKAFMIPRELREPLAKLLIEMKT
jgi:hypothetical protein